MGKGLAEKLGRWQRYNRRAILFAALLSVVFIVTMHAFRQMVFSIDRVLLAWGCVFLPLVYAPRALSARRLVPFSVFGAVCAFFIIATKTVVTPDGVPHRWTAGLLAPFVVFFVTFTLCGCGLSVLLERLDLHDIASADVKNSRRLWLWCFIAMVLCWLPSFLTFGPVRISSDSTWTIAQALGEAPLDDSHPILYTGLLALALNLGKALGSVELGAYLFGGGQLLFFAGVLSYSLYWLRRQGCPLVLCGVGLLYFVLAPTFAINAITLWKDIPFNACLLLLVLMLFPIAESRGRWLLGGKNAAAFIGLCVAVCFLRGNGYPIVAVVCLAVALAFRRHWRRWLCLFLPLLVGVALIRGPVYGAFGISRLGAEEAAALPLQQVGRAVQNGAQPTPAQAEVIERFMPVEAMAGAYNPHSVDFIKNSESFDRTAFNQNLTPFLGVWLQMAPANAEEYLNAWLVSTVGYWKYDFKGETVSVSEAYNGAGGIEFKDIILKLTGHSLRPYLHERSIFLSMGLMALVVLYVAGYLLAVRRSRMALCLLPLLVVWLGLMAGAPTKSDFRYMLVFALAMPAVLYLAAAPPRAPAALPEAPAEGPPEGAEGTPEEAPTENQTS